LKNLVFTSIGEREFRDKDNNPVEGNVIESWNDGDREFDIVAYGYDESMTGMGDCDVWIQREGTKYQNFYHYATNYAEELEQYDYVWVADDDMFMSAKDINRMFEMMVEYKIDLGQPSMDINGMHYVHILVNDPEYILRYTNYVECSAPIFTKKSLKKIVHTFADTLTGHSWDNIISHMIYKKGENNVAVFDEIKAHHGISLSRINYVSARSNHRIEGQRILKKYNYSPELALSQRDVVGALLPNGEWIPFSHMGGPNYLSLAKWRIVINIIATDVESDPPVVTWRPKIKHYPEYQWREK